MDERIKAMKKYVGTGEASKTMFLLSGAFLAVAAVLTAVGVVLGFSPRRLTLLGILWLVAIGMTGYSVVETIRSRRDTEKNAAELENMEEALQDFESAKPFPGDELRMGEKYIFASRSGGVIPYSEICSASLKRIDMQQNSFLQYCVILKSGKERVIYQRDVKFLDKRMLEGITFNIAAHNPQVRFNK